MANPSKEAKFVYLVQEVSPSNTPTKYYTVGESENRRKAVKQLQVGNARHLQIICCTSQVDPRTEGLVHEKLKSLDVYAIHHGGRKWYYCKSEKEIKSMFKKALPGILTEDCRID